MDFVNHWSENCEIPKKYFIRWLGIHESKFYDWKTRYGKENQHNGAYSCSRVPLILIHGFHRFSSRVPVILISWVPLLGGFQEWVEPMVRNEIETLSQIRVGGVVF